MEMPRDRENSFFVANFFNSANGKPLYNFFGDYIWGREKKVQTSIS